MRTSVQRGSIDTLNFTSLSPALCLMFMCFQYDNPIDSCILNIRTRDRSRWFDRNDQLWIHSRLITLTRSQLIFSKSQGTRPRLIMGQGWRYSRYIIFFQLCLSNDNYHSYLFIRLTSDSAHLLWLTFPWTINPLSVELEKWYRCLFNLCAKWRDGGIISRALIFSPFPSPLPLSAIFDGNFLIGRRSGTTSRTEQSIPQRAWAIRPRRRVRRR